MVVRDDLLPQAALQDLAHHQPVQLRLPPRSHLAEELAEVLQLEGVLLARLHPLLQVLQPLAQLSEQHRILGEESLFEEDVVLHEIPANRFGHVDILLEVLKLIQDSLPKGTQAIELPASSRNGVFFDVFASFWRHRLVLFSFSMRAVNPPEFEH